MENRENRFAINLKALRKAHRETQTELANAISVGVPYSKATISSYENGGRKPNEETLSNIATHYHTTIEMLLYGDFSELTSVTYPSSVKTLADLVLNAFPYVTSSEAEKDPLFTKALKQTKRLWNNGYTDINEYDFVLKETIETYTILVKENETVEAACNILSCLFLNWLSIANKEIDEYLARIPDEPGVVKKLFKRIYLGDIPLLTEEDRKERKRWLDINAIGIQVCLYKMKRSGIWADLADYYLALRYWFNMIDNEKSPDANNAIGKEMMIAFFEMGNQYAKEFLGKCSNL